MRAVVHVVVLGGLALAGSGCTRLHARSQPVSPRLEVPPPPPHVIAIAAVEPPEPEPSPPEEPVAPPPAEVPLRRAPRPAAAPPASTGRVEKREPPAPAVSRPVQQDSAPPQTLQTTTKLGEAEQRVRTTMAQASRDLGRIDARTLNAEAKAQYDIAKRFVQQAGDALTAKNFVFAGQLADKAAALAALLLTP